jgi:hypothetical protein
MRTLLAVLTTLMLFAATLVVAGEVEDAIEEGDAIKETTVIREALIAFDERNFPKAFRLNKPLAEQGHASAQYNLGYIYAHGEGVPEDDVKAVYWYRKSAEQGHASAQYNLGAMYADGEGVPQDNVHAYAWWSVAATQGKEDAKKYKGSVQDLMAPKQIAKGQKLAAEYWEKYVVPFQEN